MPEPTRGEELLEAAQLSMLIHYHLICCAKHGSPQRAGAVGFAAARDFIMCQWCRSKQTFKEPTPPELKGLVFNPDAPLLVDQFQPWVCRLTQQLEAFYRQHVNCVPDPDMAQKATLIARVTKDGIMNLNEDCTVGSEYTIYPNTMREETYEHLDHPGVRVKRWMVWAESSTSPEGCFLPMELFKLHAEHVH